MSPTTCTNRLAPRPGSEALADLLFGRTPTSVVRGSSWFPAASVQEFDNEFVLAVELPGVGEESIEIAVENNVLAVSGEKRAEHEAESEGKHHLQERAFGAFRRTFRMPGTVRADAISAELENGILTLRLPKAEEARARKIEVSRRA